MKSSRRFLKKGLASQRAISSMSQHGSSARSSNSRTTQRSGLSVKFSRGIPVYKPNRSKRHKEVKFIPGKTFLGEPHEVILGREEIQERIL